MEHRLETLEILKSSRKTAFDHYLGMITGYQKLVWSRSAGAPCFKDQVRQAKAERVMCWVPELQHGSGTGDH